MTFRIRSPQPPACRPLLLTLLLGLLLTGCASGAPTGNDRPDYRSVWAELFPETLTASSMDGTLQGDFRAAAGARDRAEAQKLWRDFLGVHAPADDVFEDAMQARLVQWARAEAARLDYLIEGDAARAAGEAQKLRLMARD